LKVRGTGCRGYHDKMIETTELFSHCFHCFGRIWKLTVLTFFWLTTLQNSQKRMKPVRFQILLEQQKQWKQWKQSCGLNHFCQVNGSRFTFDGARFGV